jgi:imidazoleglycerol-phosphate dehydratase
MRRAWVERETKETSVALEIDLDGCGRAELATGIPFLDHLLEAFALHGFFDLQVRARGDVEVDGHHTVEDVAICLGQAFRRALSGGGGIHRFGWCLLPMDEALVEVAADAGGRSFLVYRVPVVPRSLGPFHTEMAAEFWRAFVRESGVTMHVSLRWGENSHHILEAVWKAAGVALRQAVREAPRPGVVPSSKGPVRTAIRRPGAAEEEAGLPARTAGPPGESGGRKGGQEGHGPVATG